MSLEVGLTVRSFERPAPLQQASPASRKFHRKRATSGKAALKVSWHADGFASNVTILSSDPLRLIANLNREK